MADTSETPVQPPMDAPGTLLGSVIIPAHNEEVVIGRILKELSGDPRFEIIVVPNGCTDSTADVARDFPGVRVVELTEGSKIAALNAGDAAATVFPRAYIDADVHLSPTTLTDVFAAFDQDSGLRAARPASRYATERSTLLARAYFRAKVATVDPAVPHLWGAGCYVLSQEGRSRFDHWPDVQGDDYWIDRQFAPTEKSVIDTVPVVVRPPHTLRDVIRTGARHYRGNAAVESDTALNSATGSGPSTVRTLLRLARSVRGPRTAADAAVYAAATIASRLSARRASGPPTWERDATSRRS